MNNSSSLTDNVVEFAPAKRDVCKFCPEETVVPAWRKKVDHHLVVTVDNEGHCHVHGPLDNKAVVNQMLECVKRELEK